MTATITSWRSAGRPGWVAHRDRRTDVLLAVAITVVQVAGTYGAGLHQPERRALDVLGVALLAAGPLALVARRRHPVAVLYFAFATILVYALADYPGGPVWFALIAAFFTAQTTGHRLAGFVSIAVGYVVFLWLDTVLGREAAPSVGSAVGIGAWMLVLVAVAEIVRVRRAYADEARRRASEADRTREEEARRRQSEERVRIARDLHDVLAHKISLINVQASTALHLLDERPQQARPALTAIKQASSEALGELRSVLDMLRQAGEAAPRTPAPTLSDLGDLVSQAAVAGLQVETVVEGATRPLPPSVELAAFRICQEAVTNVMRHAGPATARVRLAYGERELVVQIDDDGRGAAADQSRDEPAEQGLGSGGGAAVDPSGHEPATRSPGGGGGGNGLPGMRERAAALGGSVEARPRPGGGFRVRATLPLEATT